MVLQNKAYPASGIVVEKVAYKRPLSFQTIESLSCLDQILIFTASFTAYFHVQPNDLSLEDKNLHTERMLFRQIAAGDQDAFSVIFRSYSNPLYWNALKLLKSEFWAEEIVQVVFEQLWANRGGLSKVELPSAYLYRMLTNKALDRIRRQAREVKMQYWLEQQGEGFSEGKHAAVDWDELHALLENAVETLPPQRREVYKLKYQDRLSYDEIAAQLSLSKNTVRNHLTKALDDIRAYLLKHAGFIGLLLWFAMLAVDASPVYRN